LWRALWTEEERVNDRLQQKGNPMSADKRKVSTDALETLGTIIGPNEKRDAIHLAVLPVMAGARLYAGQSISTKDGIATPDPNGIGIVDPFLAAAVQPEERFWMVIKPRLITSLRHVWTHPAFPDEAGVGSPDTEKAAARAAIEVIASSCDIGADEMIEGANRYLDRGDYLCEGGRWEGVYVPDEFWPHFETLTGRKVPSDQQGSFFSCSC
jgi:hypothetical protein